MKEDKELLEDYNWENLEKDVNKTLQNSKEVENQLYILSYKIVELVSENEFLRNHILRQLITKNIDKRFSYIEKPIDYLRDILDVLFSDEDVKEVIEKKENFSKILCDDISDVLRSEGKPLKAYEITDKLNEQLKKGELKIHLDPPKNKKNPNTIVSKKT